MSADDLGARIAVLEEQTRGLRDDVQSLEEFVRGPLTSSLATLSRDIGTQTVRVTRGEKRTNEQQEKISLHEKALNILVAEAEHAGGRWERLIGFGTAILQALTTAMVLYLISGMGSTGGP